MTRRSSLSTFIRTKMEKRLDILAFHRTTPKFVWITPMLRRKLFRRSLVAHSVLAKIAKTRRRQRRSH